MPYGYTHAIAAREALRKTNETARFTAEKDHSAFYLGTLGPDPYYGDALLPIPPWNVRSDLADKLHALSPRELFAAMLPLTAGDDARKAYMLGFAAHLALDKAAHPYIEGRFPGAQHSPAEIALDFPITRLLGGGWPDVSPRAFYGVRSLRSIDGLHAGMIDALYHENGAGLYARSLRKWLLVNTVSFDPTGWKRRAFAAFPGLTKYFVGPRDATETARLLNEDRTAWFAPFAPGEPRTETFPELVLTGVDNGARVMASLADAAGGGDAFAALNTAEEWCRDDTA